MLGPLLERLAAEQAGRWELAKLDTEAFPRIAAQFGIRSIPNVKLFVEGKVKAEFTGALPESAVRSWLDTHLPGVFDRSIAEARDLLQRGESGRARQILEKIVAEDPTLEDPRAILATTLLAGDPARAVELVEGIEEDSRFHDTAESVRIFAGLIFRDAAGLPEGTGKAQYHRAIEALRRGEYDGALREFIEVIRQDRPYDDDGARKACIAIFRILGEEHEITLRHRKEFNRSLY